MYLISSLSNFSIYFLKKIAYRFYYASWKKKLAQCQIRTMVDDWTLLSKFKLANASLLVHYDSILRQQMKWIHNHRRSDE